MLFSIWLSNKAFMLSLLLVVDIPTLNIFFIRQTVTAFFARTTSQLLIRHQIVTLTMQAHRDLKSSTVTDKLHFAKPFWWTRSESISNFWGNLFIMCYRHHLWWVLGRTVSIVLSWLCIGQLLWHLEDAPIYRRATTRTTKRISELPRLTLDYIQALWIAHDDWHA